MRVVSPDTLKTYFAQKVVPLIEPNSVELSARTILAIINEDKKIASDTVVDLVNNTKKINLSSKPLTAPADFLAGVFIYAVLYVPNKAGVDCISEIDETFISKIKLEITNYTVIETADNIKKEPELESGQDDVEGLSEDNINGSFVITPN
jgi:hypothetical protein